MLAKTTRSRCTIHTKTSVRVKSKPSVTRYYRTSTPTRFSTKNSSTEGGDTSATFRYPVAWKDPDFYNKEKMETEMRRVFEVCHGCRLCYSLCDSFPTLFELIDNSKTGELDSVPSTEFKKVVDKCTMCDLCFLTKCPYVPPHGLNIDFPHMILRYRAIENMQDNTAGVTLAKPTEYASVAESTGSKISPNEKIYVEKGLDRTLKLEAESFLHSLYVNTDLVGSIATKFSWLVNWATQQPENSVIRRLLQKTLNIHPKAELPRYVPSKQTFMNSSKTREVKVNANAKAFGQRKVILFATCLVNYNKPNVGHAARALLAHNGIEVKPMYPMCCGMPQLESGKVKEVSQRAEKVAQILRRYLDEGYDVVTPTASCTLMLKKEWPLLHPTNSDVRLLAERTYDVSEYLMLVNKRYGLVPLPDPGRPLHVTLHHACHSRAQAAGFKSKELLELIPGVQIHSVEKCSGHGGSFGVQQDGFNSAMKVGRSVFNSALNNLADISSSETMFVSSDCPLAQDHIVHGMKEVDPSCNTRKVESKSPLEIMADAYGLQYKQ